ncbi:hypothetical protein A8924_0493 [Saccharopolyspora erythraea NRRL 2338]|uniref:Endo-1,4-beta-glucanase n=2 Tax=Saccharopolyspora erythraea TaxID=1836 RepID=A4F5Y7_SACEN|nr:hypothetical protein [Saccharopolyspora erythraea]PFG93260.1 hypothetical protein A8924_0493 [Saccharopolyspora erythraea NRRL 2338]QRK90112.1 1,4-beta-glucanase [Saccharopolyspora erythraea]CAL99461.1 endo-1,4-beta-glucanase [Saccharopolyspora erythraea NRRL 2338]
MNDTGRFTPTDRVKPTRSTGNRTVAAVLTLGIAGGLGMASLGTAQAEPVASASTVAGAPSLTAGFKQRQVTPEEAKQVEDDANKAFRNAEEARNAADAARATANELEGQRAAAEAERGRLFGIAFSKLDELNAAEEQLAKTIEDFNRAEAAAKADPTNVVLKAVLLQARLAFNDAVQLHTNKKEELRQANTAVVTAGNQMRELENRVRMAESAARSAEGAAEVADQEFAKAAKKFEDVTGVPFVPKPVEVPATPRPVEAPAAPTGDEIVKDEQKEDEQNKPGEEEAKSPAQTADGEEDGKREQDPDQRVPGSGGEEQSSKKSDDVGTGSGVGSDTGDGKESAGKKGTTAGKSDGTAVGEGNASNGQNTGGTAVGEGDSTEAGTSSGGSAVGAGNATSGQSGSGGSAAGTGDGTK